MVAAAFLAACSRVPDRPADAGAPLALAQQTPQGTQTSTEPQAVPTSSKGDPAPGQPTPVGPAKTSPKLTPSPTQTPTRKATPQSESSPY